MSLIDRYYDQDKPKEVKRKFLKNQFAVLNLQTGDFLKKYTGGKTWTSLKHALNAAENSGWPLHDLIVEEYEPVIRKKYNVGILIHEKREKEREKKLKKIELNEKHTEVVGSIKECFPNNISLTDIKSLYQSDTLSNDLYRKLNPLMSKLKEIENEINTNR